MNVQPLTVTQARAALTRKALQLSDAEMRLEATPACDARIHRVPCERCSRCSAWWAASAEVERVRGEFDHAALRLEAVQSQERVNQPIGGRSE